MLLCDICTCKCVDCCTDHGTDCNKSDYQLPSSQLRSCITSMLWTGTDLFMAFLFRPVLKHVYRINQRQKLIGQKDLILLNSLSWIIPIISPYIVVIGSFTLVALDSSSLLDVDSYNYNIQSSESITKEFLINYK